MDTPRPTIDHLAGGSLVALDVLAGGRVVDAVGPPICHQARGPLGTWDVAARRSPNGGLGLDAPGPTVDHLARGSLVALDVTAGGPVGDTLGPTVDHVARGPLGAVDVTAGGLPVDALGPPM